MDFLNAFLSGPVPSVVAIIIALLLAAGYWFFVFPLVNEVASLREINNKMTAELLQQNANASAFASALKELKHGKLDQGALNKLLEAQDIVQKSLRDVSNGLLELKEKSLRTDSELIHNLERIVRMVSEVNDKQSQVSGVILGLTMSHAHNPARGI